MSKKIKKFEDKITTKEEAILSSHLKKRDIQNWQAIAIKRIKKLMSDKEISRPDIYSYISKGGKHLYDGEKIKRTTLSNYLTISKDSLPTPISITNLLVLCECFNCTPNYLLGYDNESNYDMSDEIMSEQLGLDIRTIKKLKAAKKASELPDYKSAIYRNEDANGDYYQLLFTSEDDSGEQCIKTYEEIIDEFKHIGMNKAEKPSKYFFETIDMLINHDSNELINDLADYLAPEETISNLNSEDMRRYFTRKDALKLNSEPSFDSELKKMKFLSSLDSFKHSALIARENGLWAKDTLYNPRVPLDRKSITKMGAKEIILAEGSTQDEREKLHAMKKALYNKFSKKYGDDQRKLLLRDEIRLNRRFRHSGGINIGEWVTIRLWED